MVPYSARSYKASESLCRHEDSDVIAKVTYYEKLRYDADAMIDKLREQPLIVGIYSRNSAFRYYESGVIREDDCSSVSNNHAVALVGFNIVGDEPPAPEPSDNCVVNEWWYSCPQRRELQSTPTDANYFRIQNSWGDDYGDKGFALVEIVDGAGPCGINRGAYWHDAVYV